MNATISDREVMVAIFELLGSLSQELTGRTPSVKLTLAEGGFVMTSPSADKVNWDPKGLADDPKELRPMPR